MKAVKFLATALVALTLAGATQIAQADRGDGRPGGPGHGPGGPGHGPGGPGGPGHGPGRDNDRRERMAAVQAYRFTQQAQMAARRGDFRGALYGTDAAQNELRAIIGNGNVAFAKKRLLALSQRLRMVLNTDRRRINYDFEVRNTMRVLENVQGDLERSGLLR